MLLKSLLLNFFSWGLPYGSLRCAARYSLGPRLNLGLPAKDWHCFTSLAQADHRIRLRHEEKINETSNTKPLAVLLLFCFFTLNLFAQDTTQIKDRSNYALLWEITGPQISKPSYVFGSMHVRYPSVFEFPDSLLHCLAASDAFANEIHLDAAMQRIFQVYLDQEELDVDSSYIRLIHEHIVLPDTSLKSGKEDSLSDFKSFVRNRKEVDDLRSGDNMPTMLDAYLMEAARRLGKTLYGLEDIDEHLYESEDILIAEPTQFKFSWFGNNTDDLLRLYYEGDLEAIDAFIHTEPDGFNQFALVGRNYIMVDAMERIMPNKSLFSVVGAAHLPGEQGVLELLRQRGYHLRRVTPSFTGLRDSFLLPEIERPWPTTLPQRGLYQLAMPLGIQHTYREGVNVSHLCFDMGRGLSYLLLSTSMLPYDYNSFDDVFFTQDGYEIIKKVPFHKGDLKGFRYELEMLGNEVQYYHGYTFFYDQQLYYLQIGAYEKNTLESPDVKRFIDEFDLLKKTQHKWVMRSDSVGGFMIRMPSTYIYSQSARNEAYPYQKAMDFPSHHYYSGFEKSRASVWFQYFDVSPGDAPPQLWDQMQKAVDELEYFYGVDVTILNRDPFMSYPSWELSGEFVDKGLLLKGRVIARGNRIYLLSSVDDKRQTSTKKFFPSFKLLPLSNESDLQQFTYFDQELKLTLPGRVATELEVLENDLTTNERYRQYIRGLDTISGASYEIEIQKLPYAFFVYDSLAFYEQELQAMLGETDSLLTQQLVQMSNAKTAKVYTYTSQHDQLQQQFQLYRHGAYWVKKRMVALPDYFTGTACQAFFTADQWETPPNYSPTLLNSSAEIIGEQLCAKDTLTVQRALKSIHPSLSFQEIDLPVLKEVLLNNNWSASGLQQAASQKIITVLKAIGENGYELLVGVFAEISTEGLKEALLAELALQPDRASRNTLFQILAQNQTLSDADAAKVLASFGNNPALVIQYWANFSQLLIDAQEPLYTWELAAQVLSQDSLSKAPVLAARHLFLERGQERLLAWQQQGGEMPKEIFEVYELLPEAPGLLTQVEQILDRSNVDLASVEAAGYLLSRGKTLPKKKIRQILRAPHLRVPFIRELNRYNRLDLVETRYFSAAYIAQSMLVEKLVKEGNISNVELVDEVEILFRGDPQRAFVFSFDSDDNRSRLGVVGFFSTDNNKKNFLDEGLVNYTHYTINKRHQTRKAEQLLEEMQNW